MRTEKEIKAEIKALKELKSKVRPFTAFGDDNQLSIGVQIETLEQNLSENDIFDRGDEELQGDSAWPERAVDAAREAAIWADGQSNEKPSDGWKPLVIQ